MQHLAQLADPSTHKKGFRHLLLLDVWQCWQFSRRKEAKRMKINKFSAFSKQFSGWKFICVFSRLLRLLLFFHFDCAKNRNSLFLSAFLASCMAQKIYSETFITSKNPTE
jgi:hypothetical protein